MYGREYGGKTLNFEPSGGLIHASLVMQDKETDTYWSIMSGTALSGDLEGTPLVELPVGVKAQWKDWRRDHPETLVLSVGGAEHIDTNPYDNYFSSDSGFRGMEAEDDRLPTKEPVYAFQRGGRAYAIPYAAYAGGAVFEVGDERLFLYRPEDAAIFYSSVAVVTADGTFDQKDGGWRHAPSNTPFIEKDGGFATAAVEPLDGFDTFWFNWSMSNPDTEVLE